MKKVLLFGSTGSIGRCSLDIIAKNKDDFSVYGLCAYKNVDTLAQQVRKFRPRYACVVDGNAAKRAKLLLPGKVTLLTGEAGLEEFSSLSADISIMGISGIACLKALLTNIRSTGTVALANKESMVVAGGLVKREAALHNTTILPVDSEINALFQTLELFKKNTVAKIYLTASGGPLFNLTKRTELKKVRVRDVLRHPTWKMGKRITIDSATLLNKGFEVIEAHRFFNFDYGNIDIVVHRESKVHSVVQLNDGTSFFCFYEPDMRMPIGHTLYYPRRVPFLQNKGFSVEKEMGLSFFGVDYKKFPLLELVLDAAKRDDNSLAAVNASDEVAVEFFLRKKIDFLSIYKTVEYVFSHCPKKKPETLQDILFWDGWARQRAKEYLERKCCLVS